jgi:hypothetical protein
MGYPSMLPLETWMRPWHGELREETTTAAEAFASVGYRTFWVGHDHNRAFSRAILGFQQGFETVSLVHESPRAKRGDTDAQIADRAIELIRAQDGREGRFFGWIVCLVI